ncbi:MAG: hypothetical protein NTV95_01820 [Candidatus Saccharibacteria bacterium]|nr:hypothetical protein [Candidatus Saccharibacteria bacterium]
MEHLNSPEMPKPVQIYEQINQLHEDFYKLVPQYDREIWSPEKAIKIRAGGCMSELLYVSGGLLYEGTVKEEDLSVRFSSSHGKIIKKGMIGDQVPDLKHVVLLLNIDNQQYECDFRLNRADEKPQFSKVPNDSDSYSDKSIEFFTLKDGLKEYAGRTGVQKEEIPTIAEIVSIHAPHQPSHDTDKVRFDEDF